MTSNNHNDLSYKYKQFKIFSLKAHLKFKRFDIMKNTKYIEIKRM